MARAKGDLGFSGNFEVEKAGPFDARGLVDLKSDLINADTWASLSGESYLYIGMTTTVGNDPVEENNGIYRLKALPATEEANWVKEGGSEVASVALATNEEYAAGTSTTVAPNVAQVKGDITSLTTAVQDAVADIPVNVSELTNDSGFIDSTVATLDNFYNKTDIDTKISSVYKFQGTVADYAALEAITDAENGDVYNVLDTGDNYAWDASAAEGAGAWDKLSGTVDLSGYSTTEEINTALSTKQDTLVAGTGITIDPDTNEISSTAVGGESYTNTEESVITVGGIEEGTVFTDYTFANLMDGLFFPELNPALNNPNSTFTENAPPLVEVGAPTTINFNTTFSRGSVTPAYKDGPSFRSGLPNQYRYTGPNLPPTVDSTALSDAQVLADYVITTPSEVTWTSQVSYDAGEQPLTSKGNAFNTPLAAGTTQVRSTSVRAVYPHYATSSTITELTKQGLSNNAYYEVSLIGEDDLGNKQTVEWAIIGENVLTGIEMYNTNSGKWEWLSGSRDASKVNFTASEVTKTINGNEVQYRKYVNNSAKVGARQLRFYI